MYIGLVFFLVVENIIYVTAKHIFPRTNIGGCAPRSGVCATCWASFIFAMTKQQAYALAVNRAATYARISFFFSNRCAKRWPNRLAQGPSAPNPQMPTSDPTNAPMRNLVNTPTPGLADLSKGNPTEDPTDAPVASRTALPMAVASSCGDNSS